MGYWKDKLIGSEAQYLEWAWEHNKHDLRHHMDSPPSYFYEVCCADIREELEDDHSQWLSDKLADQADHLRNQAKEQG